MMNSDCNGNTYNININVSCVPEGVYLGRGRKFVLFQCIIGGLGLGSGVCT